MPRIPTFRQPLKTSGQVVFPLAGLSGPVDQPKPFVAGGDLTPRNFPDPRRLAPVVGGCCGRSIGEESPCTVRHHQCGHPRV